MKTLIRGGRILDPQAIDIIGDMLIEDGNIAAILNGDDLIDPPHDMQVIEADGLIVTPGLIDMHVHFREPGQEYKETIQTGCLAAAHGGFTTVLTMPNTNPVNDNEKITEYIIEKAKKAGTVKVLPVGAISRGLSGKSLCNHKALKQAGAVAITDDGFPVMDSLVMRKAMESAKKEGLLVISHCEDMNLAGSGTINEGPVAVKLGLKGIPNVAESVMAIRDIALCELTGAPCHIAHVSTMETVRAVREAKKQGIPVTAETAPHYFSLTDKAVEQLGAYAKMNPPLRTQRDQEAICQGLSDGTIDAIATDHAPHASFEKDIPIEKAANGIIGLETALALGLGLVDSGILSIERLILLMSKNPAKILGIDNSLKVGNPADITIINPEKEFKVNARDFKSKSHNTPFAGWRLTGKPVFTIVNGKVVSGEMDKSALDKPMKT